MNKKRKMSSIIFTHTLDKVSKNLFEKHREIIIKHIGSQPGAYALYHHKKLYYVGRASDLAKRVKDHLSDRHANFWTHFSVYFFKKASFANDIESIMISVAKPEGNRNKPSLGKKINLNDLVRKDIKRKHQEELEELVGHRQKRNNLKKTNNSKIIKSIRSKERLPVRFRYKSKTYKAVFFPSEQKVKYKNKKYSVSTACQVIMNNKFHRNGWKAWFIEDDQGKRVYLDELRNK